MIAEPALRGYVLEEVLARLLRENGYSLLAKESQDREALRDGPHGLLVRGRGADHQADALGELQIPTPFSLPLRLFAEAKFRDEAVDITAIRNAVGLLDDVNEQYRNDIEHDLPLRRYHYRYALFSTKGFTADAQKYALVHQISLVDLQGPAFEHLRAVTADVTSRLLDLAQQSGLDSFPVGQTRAALRHALGTWTADDRPDDAGSDPSSDPVGAKKVTAGQSGRLPPDRLAHIAIDLRANLADKLMLGFPRGPFVLVLQPDDPEAFDAFLKKVHGDVRVQIRYATSGDGTSGEWAITPLSRGAELVVRFGIPPLLDAWLLAAGEAEQEYARIAKKTLFSTIAVFHHENRLTRLRYTKVERRESANQILSENVPFLRRELASPDLAFKGRRVSPRGDAEAYGPARSSHWTSEGLNELLNRLDNNKHWQAAVIRRAAAQGGRISRREVYEIGKIDPESTLRGFQQPITRVTQQLQRERRVAEGVGVILKTFHGSDGRATHFIISPDVQALLVGF